MPQNEKSDFDHDVFVIFQFRVFEMSSYVDINENI